MPYTLKGMSACRILEMLQITRCNEYITTEFSSL